MEKVWKKTVYYEVCAYGCGVIGQYKTYGEARKEACNSLTQVKITKVTKEELEVGG